MSLRNVLRGKVPQRWDPGPKQELTRAEASERASKSVADLHTVELEQPVESCRQRRHEGDAAQAGW
jgi:hypothetical protein